MTMIPQTLDLDAIPLPVRKPRSAFLETYVAQIDTAIYNAQVTTLDGRSMDTEVGFSESVHILNNPKKVIYFVGNGGSAAIASHMATDFSKNGGLPALFLGDASLLTCLSNDLGYDEVFAKPLRQLMRPEDVLVAISSSGNSENILNAVRAAQAIGAKSITLSGFSANNALRKMGTLNWYLRDGMYGIVENAHQILIHAFLDKILES